VGATGGRDTAFSAPLGLPSLRARGVAQTLVRRLMLLPAVAAKGPRALRGGKLSPLPLAAVCAQVAQEAAMRRM